MSRSSGRRSQDVHVEAEGNLLSITGEKKGRGKRTGISGNFLRKIWTAIHIATGRRRGQDFRALRTWGSWTPGAATGAARWTENSDSDWAKGAGGFTGGSPIETPFFLRNAKKENLSCSIVENNLHLRRENRIARIPLIEPPKKRGRKQCYGISKLPKISSLVILSNL